MLDPRVKLKSFYDKCVQGMVDGKISWETRYYVQCKMDEDMIEDYMKECGVSTREQIDWNNPVVAVAHLLHDPLYRHYILNGGPKHKQIVYDLMTPEMLEVYWNYVGDSGGKFCDLEDKKARKRDKKNYKRATKEKHI